MSSKAMLISILIIIIAETIMNISKLMWKKWREKKMAKAVGNAPTNPVKSFVRMSFFTVLDMLMFLFNGYILFDFLTTKTPITRGDIGILILAAFSFIVFLFVLLWDIVKLTAAYNGETKHKGG